MEDIDVMDYDKVVLIMTPENYLAIKHYVQKYQNVLDSGRAKQKNKYKPTIVPRLKEPNLSISYLIKDDVEYDVHYT